MKRTGTKELLLTSTPWHEINLVLQRAGAVWEWEGDMDDELEFSVSKANSDWLRSQIAIILGKRDHKWQKVHDTPSAETWHYWFFVDSIP